MRKKPPQQNPLKGQQSKKRAQSTPEIAEVRELIAKDLRALGLAGGD